MPPTSPQGEGAPKVKSPEIQAKTPEAVEIKTPETPAEPTKETFQDQSAPPVVEPTIVQAPTEPPKKEERTVPPTEKDDQKDTTEIDSKWVDAVEQVIEKTEGKPYEEEEEAETLQIKYLFKRFGKILKRDKNDQK
jgi:hypothetical protein